MEDVYALVSLKEVEAKAEEPPVAKKDIPQPVPPKSGSSVDVMDFAEAFPLAASLVNSIEVEVKRVHLRVENGECKRPLLVTRSAFNATPFAVGVTLQSLVLKAPKRTMGSGEGAQELSVKGLSVYWMTDGFCLASRRESEVKEWLKKSCQTDPMPESVLQGLDLSVLLHLDLRRIEERQLPGEECLERVVSKGALSQEEAAILRRVDLSHSEEEYCDAVKLQTLNAGLDDAKRARLLTAAHQFYGEVKTPRPLAAVSVVVERVHLALSHEQYACAMRLLPALQAAPSVPAAECAVPAAEKVESVTSVKEVESATSVKEVESVTSVEKVAGYKAGVLQFALRVATLLFRSYPACVCFLAALCLFPCLLFRSPKAAVLLLLLAALATALAFLLFRTRLGRLNRRWDAELHAREQWASAAVCVKEVCVEVADARQQEGPLVQLALVATELQCSVRDVVEATVSLGSLSIRDGVASRLKRRPCFLLATTALAGEGSAVTGSSCFAKVSLLLQLQPRADKSDVDVSVAVGNISVAVLPLLLEALLSFALPLPAAASPQSTPQSTPQSSAVPTEGTAQSTERAAEKPLPTSWTHSALRLSARVDRVQLLLDTARDTPLFSLAVDGVGAAVDVTAGTVAVDASVRDVSLLDTTEGCGVHRAILAIDHAAAEQFVTLRLDAVTDPRCPASAGCPLSLRGAVAPIVVVAHVRWAYELLNDLTLYEIQSLLAKLQDLSPSPSKPEETKVETETKMETTKVEATKAVALPSLDVRVGGLRLLLPRSSDCCDGLSVAVSDVLVKSGPEEPNALRAKLGFGLSATTRGRCLTHVGVTDLDVRLVLAQTLGVTVEMSPLAVALAEDQVIALISLLVQALQERPVLFPCKPLPLPAESLPPTTALDAPQETPSRAPKSEPESEPKSEPAPTRRDSTTSVDSLTSELEGFEWSSPVPEPEVPQVVVDVKLRGLVVEWLRGDAGYEGVVHGTEMLRRCGSLAGSLVSLHVTDLRASVTVRPSGLSLGASLNAIEMRDSRPESSLVDGYKAVLRIGTWNAPALAVLLDMKDVLLEDLPNAPAASPAATVKDISLSAHLGELAVVPSSYVFALLDALFPFLRRLLAALKPVDFAALLPPMQFGAPTVQPAQPAQITQTKETPLPNLFVTVSFEGLSVYVVEDPEDAACPVFLLCFGLNATVAVAPWQTVEVAARMTDLRACRSNNSLTLLPVDVDDTIAPFNFWVRCSVEDHFSAVRLTAHSSSLHLRLGVLDATLLANFLRHLLPEPLDTSKYSLDVPSESAKPEAASVATADAVAEPAADTPTIEPTEPATMEEPRLSVQAEVKLDEIKVILVNDALEFELPILQLLVSDIGCRLQLDADLALQAGLTLAGDYYKPSAAVWEPYLEPWSVQASVARESSPEPEKDSLPRDKNTVAIAVTSPTLLQVNCTAPLLSSIASAVESFVQCRHSRHRRGDGCFVGVKNGTGLEMTYCIESDGGVNHTLLSASERARQAMRWDELLFEDMVEVEVAGQRRAVWLEMHGASPRLRLFDAIPVFVAEEGAAPFLATDRFAWREDAVDIVSEGMCATLRVSEDDAAAWQERFRRVTETQLQSPRVLLSMPAVEEVSLHKEVSVGDAVVPTPLLVHPSLYLMFLGQEYRQLPPRSIRIQLPAFAPILCPVDRERELFVPLEDAAHRRFDAVVHNGEAQGRKVIEVTSTVCVENCTSLPVQARFVAKDAEEAAFAPLPAKEPLFCPLSIIHSAVLQLSAQPDAVECAGIDIASLEKACPSCVNLGTAAAPLFVRVVVHHRTVFDAFGKQATDLVRLSLVPVLVLQNLLPVPFAYRVVRGSQVLREGSLAEGEKEDLFVTEANPALQKQDQPLRVRVRPAGSETFSLFDDSLVPFVSDAPQSLLVYDENNLPLRLSYYAKISQAGEVLLQVFCDFWILNRTGEALTVAEKKEDPSTRRLCPAQNTSFCLPADFATGADHALKPMLFSTHVTDSAGSAGNASFFFKTGESQWSGKLGIGAVGTTGTTTLTMDKASACRQKKVFGISIAPAPGMFGFTKVVTIAPSLLLLNKTRAPLEVLQEGTSAPLLLEVGKPTPFHWPQQDQPLRVCFRSQGAAASTAFCGLEVGEHQLLLPSQSTQSTQSTQPNQSNQPCVIRVDSVLELEHVNVVIDEADAFNTELFLRKQEKGLDYKALLAPDSRFAPVAVDFVADIAGLGVSVVDQSPREILYLAVEGVSARVALCSDQSLALSASVRRVQVDNSIAGSKYPVLFGSTAAGEVETAEDGSPREKRMIDVSVRLLHHPSVLYLKYVGFLLQPCSVAVDSPTVIALLDMMSEFAVVSAFFDRASGRAVLDAAPLLADATPFVDTTSQQYCYIEELLLQPISVRLSLHNSSSAPLTEDLLPASSLFTPLRALVNTVTSLVANLQNAALQLNSFAMTDAFVRVSQLVSKLVVHYVLQVVSKLYLLLGAFNLIGNPVELVGNLSEGVTAFFFEPMECLVKQPKDFVGSVGKGASKLLSLTTYGLLNSVSKVTDTVGNGLASLSMSESFQADRAAGKTGLVHGLSAGVKGLYKDTSAGLKEEGLIGGVKGLGSAVTGLVIDPLAGAVSSVTNAVNGVKNIIHKEKELAPLRQPRCVPLDGFLAPYDPVLARGAALLRAVNRDTAIELAPRERYVCHCPVDDGARVVLFTTRKVLLLSAGGKLLWYDDYARVALVREEKKVHVQKRGKPVDVANGVYNDQCAFEAGSPEVASLLCAFVEKVEEMPVEDMAEFARQLLQLIDPSEEKKEAEQRLLPDLSLLTIEDVRYVSKTVMLAGESYNEDTKRKHIMYKVEVRSEPKDGHRVLWNVYFRYTALQLESIHCIDV